MKNRKVITFFVPGILAAVLSACGSQATAVETAGEPAAAVVKDADAAEPLEPTIAESDESKPVQDLAVPAQDITARLTADDFFSITGRGCVITGSVEAGTFSAGDTVTILRKGVKVGEATLKSIEMDRNIVDVANTGESVGLLLEGVERSELEIGDEVVLYGDIVQAASDAVTTAYSPDDLKQFFTQLEQYARTGDVQLLDYLSFDDERELAGMEAILTDETARSLWCAAYAPTVWHVPEFAEGIDLSKSGSLQIHIKMPYWRYMNYIHIVLTGGEQMSEEPEAIKGYFETYANEIPYRYANLLVQYDENGLKLDGNRFAEIYVGIQSLPSALKEPLSPFMELVTLYEYTLELPDEMTEEEQLFTEYYQLVADNKFFEAIELVKGSRYEIKSFVLTDYQALTAEQKQKVQDELDKLPKGVFYQYSQVGPKGELNLRGLLISYGLEHSSEYEMFGEGMPLVYKNVSFGYGVYGKPTQEHFPAFYNIIMNIDKY